jgi:hypothetical protein
MELTSHAVEFPEITDEIGNEPMTLRTPAADDKR